MPDSTIGSSSAEWPEAQYRHGCGSIVGPIATSLVTSMPVVAHAVPKACFSQKPKCSRNLSKRESKCAQRKNALQSLAFPLRNIHYCSIKRALGCNPLGIDPVSMLFRGKLKVDSRGDTAEK